MGKRKAFLDMARGVAIVLVVAGHLLACKEAGIIQDKYPLYCIFSFHMPLFFIISGWLLPSSFDKIRAGNLKECLKSTAMRLLVAYVVWHAIYYALRAAAGVRLDPLDWILILVTFRGVAPIWFLGALFLAKCVVLILYRICPRGKETPILAAIAVVCLLVTAFGMTVDLSALVKWQRYLAIAMLRLFPCVFFMLAGYAFSQIAAKLRDKAWARHRVVELVIGAACLAAVLAVQAMRPHGCNMQMFDLGDSFVRYFALALVGSAGVLAVCKAFEGVPGITRLFSALGTASLGIMLVHYKPFPVMHYGAKTAALIGMPDTVIAFLIALAVSVALSCAIVWLVRRRLFI